jgi:hypothetical protein
LDENGLQRKQVKFSVTAVGRTGLGRLDGFLLPSGIAGKSINLTRGTGFVPADSAVDVRDGSYRHYFGVSRRKKQKSMQIGPFCSMLSYCCFNRSPV